MRYFALIICTLLCSCATFKGIETAPAIEAVTSEACKIACLQQDKVSQEFCEMLCEEALATAQQEIEERI